MLTLLIQVIQYIRHIYLNIVKLNEMAKYASGFHLSNTLIPYGSSE